MDHKTMQERLFELYDGELDPVSRKEVEAHLTGCSECRSVTEGWKATASLFFKAPEVKPSEFFVHQVMERVRALEPERVARSAFGLRWLVPAMGLALLVIAMLPSGGPSLSMDTLLLQGNGDSSWLFSNNSLSTDDTLQWVMEEQS